MILYTNIELENPTAKPILVPSTAQSIIIDNYSPYQFTLTSTQGTLSVLPFSSRTFPTSQGATWEVSPSGSVPTTSLGNVVFNVSVFYSTHVFSNYGQSSSLPLFNAPITITNATVNVGGTINANISNATINVKGAVNASITNATINVKAGSTFPISGTVDANITNASLTVAGNVNASITNATINVKAGSTFPISGSVNINSGQTVLVRNATNSNLTVAGTVNANIQNATIDTNSTVVNEQLVTGQGHIVNTNVMNFPASSTASNSTTVVVVPAGGVILSSDIQVAVQSALGYTYNIKLLPSTLSKDGTAIATNSSGLLFNDVTPIPVTFGSNFVSSLALGYGFTVLTECKVIATPTASNTGTDNVTVYIVVNGQSVEIADQDVNLAVYTPNGIALAQAFTNTSTNTPVAVSVSNPLPTVIANGHKLFTRTGTVGGGGTQNFTSSTMNNIYGCWLSAGGNAGGVLRVEMSTGAWINQVVTPNNNQQSVSNFDGSNTSGINVGGGYPKFVQLYGTSTDSVFYTITIEYD